MQSRKEKNQKIKLTSFEFSWPIVFKFYSLQFITVKQAKQHISLCNLEDFEKEEQEFQEVENELPVLSDQSLLLEDHHLKTVRFYYSTSAASDVPLMRLF